MRKKLPSSSAKSCSARASFLVTFAVAIVFLVQGCGAACDTADDGNLPEHYTGGTATNGVYESSSWTSGLLPFPGGKQYQLDHHLGFSPADLGIFIAFGPDGEPLSLCAGNSCLVRCVDDQMIWIKNDTCADFWVRVVAQGKSFESRGALCTDGGIDAGSTVEAAGRDAGEEVSADSAQSDQVSIEDASRVE